MTEEVLGYYSTLRINVGALTADQRVSGGLLAAVVQDFNMCLAWS